MQVTTKAIVISSLKYGDSSLIVKAYTLSDGIKSYLIRGVFGRKKSKFKPGLFLPFNLLELVAHHKNKGTLESLREVRIHHPLSQVQSQIQKNSITLFLAEVLKQALREEESNPTLFAFLEYAIKWLDANVKIANYHLVFLLQLTQYLGFYPELSHRGLPYFDLLEGSFVLSPSLNPIIEKEEIVVFKSLLGINFDSATMIKISKKTRQQLLLQLLLYYELHLDGFKQPKSLPILQNIFR